MCEILIKINCPYCQSSKVVKNGKKKNGVQNLLCRSCKKQLQPNYRHRGANPAISGLILRMLQRNSGTRDIENVLQVSRGCVPRTLCRRGEEADVKPSRSHYPSVQIDEVWSYVGRRKKGKYWLLYAYSPEFDEVIGYVCGSRSAKTVRALMKKPEDSGIDEYCTYKWRSFSEVLPAGKHKAGKDYTKNIEGADTYIRARNRRSVRRTTCFPEKKGNHRASLDIMFTYRNEQKCHHHTF